VVDHFSCHEEAVVIEDLVVKQLIAVRASAEALIQSIDMFQSLTEHAKPVTGVAPASPPPTPLPINLDECTHPQEHRMPTPTMGNMKRQMCGVCGKEVVE
jgi:hypothetical protein